MPPAEFSKQNSKTSSISDAEQYLELLLLNTHEPFVMMDPDLNIITYNREFEEQYLKYFGSKIAKGLSILNYVQQSNAEALRAVYQQALSGIAHQSEIEVLSPDNKQLFFLLKYKPAYNKSGKIAGVFVSSTEITEIKRSRELLVSSENRFRSIINNANDIISLTDSVGKIEYISPALERVTGFSPGEITGKSIFSIVHPDQMKLSEAVLEQVLKNPGVSIPRTNQFLHKKGHYVWVEGAVTNLLHDPDVKAIVANYHDITHAKEAEEKLRQNEERLTAIFDNEPECVKIVDLSGKLLDMNAAGLRMLAADSLSQLKGQEVIGLIHPEDVKIYREMHKTSCLGEPSSASFRIINFKKNTMWMETNSVPLRKSNGKIYAVLSVTRDATQRITAQQEKEFDHNNLHALINNTNDLMWSISRDGQLISSNKPFDEMIKLMSGSPVTKGQAPTAGFPEEQLKKWEILYARALQGESFTIIEYTNFHQEVWAEISFYPIKHGDEIIGTACYSRDITERKLFERKLEENTLVLLNYKKELEYKELRLKQAQAIAHVGNWEIDLEENISSWSDEAYRIYGLEPAEHKFSREQWKDFIHPEDLEGFEKEMDRAHKNLSDSSHSHRIVRGDGTIRHIVAESRFEFNKKGQAVRLIGAVQDITKNKEAELELKTLNEKLEKRAKELAISNADLEQFAYIASHDLQEPLRMVTSFLTQLENKYKSQLDDKAKQYIHFATDGAVRMRRLILDLLEYSRMGRQVNTKERIDTNDLLGEVLKLNRSVVAEKKAVVDWKDLPVISGNKTAITQVFQNLVGNALKYQTSRSTPFVHIKGSETDTHWQFSISDNGIGIEEKYFDKIFIVFQRLHNKDEYSGTGIGLSICKKIIENHQGQIEVESEYGKGTTFNFTIAKPALMPAI